MDHRAPHLRAKGLKPHQIRPAKELCSECGLCDTHYIHYVKQACAFIAPDIQGLEAKTHGRQRDLDNDNELYFGVHQQMWSARKQQPIAGAQWTGIVSAIAMKMLTTGTVEGVVCVQNQPQDRFAPKVVVARTPEAVLAARVNKPTLSPNLSVLEEVESSGLRKLLVIGVGCQIQALRAVQDKLNLEALYVLGTPCVDNVSRAGLQKFLETTSRSPQTVVHYEFMQDFNVHFKHKDGSVEIVPFFGLNTKVLKDVFAPSCMTCFDYTNALADLVVGYMGAPFGWQWLVVRNHKGQQMLDLVKEELTLQPVTSSGDRRSAVQQGITAYDRAVTLPLWLSWLIGFVVNRIGPKGLEYGRFSIDSHFARNYLYIKRHYPHKMHLVPEFARKILSPYRLPAD
ncbi:MAG: Coenzyme F420 hydrogenase/dehydrogenase, beta subunit C-terminal domain [Pseudanabaenaceae cyanobacterium]